MAIYFPSVCYHVDSDPELESDSVPIQIQFKFESNMFCCYYGDLVLDGFIDKSRSYSDLYLYDCVYLCACLTVNY